MRMLLPFCFMAGARRASPRAGKGLVRAGAPGTTRGREKKNEGAKQGKKGNVVLVFRIFAESRSVIRQIHPMHYTAVSILPYSSSQCQNVKEGE